MRILGIDHGERKIGLAISDETELLARPLKVLGHRSRAEDAKAIADLAAAEGAGQIVVGLPRQDDDEEGPQACRARRWAEGLREACGLPVEFWDESFSTAEAAKILQATGSRLRRGRRRGKTTPRPDDAIAAAVMLQGYLDARRAL